jgi:hypothetical protein
LLSDPNLLPLFLGIKLVEGAIPGFAQVYFVAVGDDLI